jgi:hypothetical protein
MFYYDLTAIKINCGNGIAVSPRRTRDGTLTLFLLILNGLSTILRLDLTILGKNTTIQHTVP